MKLYFTIAALLFAAKLMACDCAIRPDFKDTTALKGYDFIALVKIVKLPPRSTTFPDVGVSEHGDIQMEVKELFKGQSSSIAFDPYFGSDCALSLEIGQEWLFFGSTYKGKINVSYCGYTVRYKDEKGVRDWVFFRGLKQLALLRQLYGHPANTNATTKVFYPDGKIEIEQSFKKNRLNGARKIYYPDGKLYVAEAFKDGRHIGMRDVYNEYGQLISHVTYKGNFILQKIQYHDLSYKLSEITYLTKYPANSYWGKKKYAPREPLVKIDSVKVLKSQALPNHVYRYKPDGRGYTYQCFYFDGKLARETELDWDKKVAEEWLYEPNGELESHKIYDEKKDKTTIDYQGGKNTSRVFTCESCQFYFVPNAPPEGTPEPGYIL